MACMNQDKKKILVDLAKPIMKKYGIKATFAVRNHSTIVCNIKSGKLDLINNYKETTRAEDITSIDVNPYHYHDHFSGEAAQFMTELFQALNTGNHDNSDIQTDYFDVGWYVDVNVGKWNKPYVLEK